MPGSQGLINQEDGDGNLGSNLMDASLLSKMSSKSYFPDQPLLVLPFLGLL